MALSQHDLLRLMESLRTAAGIELIRTSLGAGATGPPASAPGPVSMPGPARRCAADTGEGAAWQAGDRGLAILRVCVGSFFPACWDAGAASARLCGPIMGAYVHGVSARGVDGLVRALGSDSGISRSGVFWICGGFGAGLSVFRARLLDRTWFPWLCPGAAYCRARVNDQTVSQAVVTAADITGDGDGEVLDPWPATAGPRCSGASSRARCACAAWAGSAWSSPSTT